MSEHLVNAISVAPPVAVAGTVLIGVPLNEWVLILTALYTAVQSVVTIYNFIIKLRDKVSGSE